LDVFEILQIGRIEIDHERFSGIPLIRMQFTWPILRKIRNRIEWAKYLGLEINMTVDFKSL
jgi:hypothetical protein